MVRGLFMFICLSMSVFFWAYLWFLVSLRHVLKYSDSGKLLQMLTQATITVLLKKDKNSAQRSSYRPISLLCCYYKILTKTLARHLDPLIPTIIDEDQTGLISIRESFF